MNWKQFETTFMMKFSEDETHSRLLMKISSIKVELKEKIKYINQILLTLLNRIPTI